MHRRVRISEVLMFLVLAVSGGVNGMLTVPATAHDAAKPPRFAAERANPLPHSDTVLAAGRGIYEKACASCHGPSGSGDTPAASAFSHRPSDFTKGFKGQSDGALFWTITKGGGAMPAYDTTLTEEQRWQVVHYLRTLEVPPKGPRP